MKKFLTLISLFFITLSVSSQSEFGMTAGFVNGNARVTAFGEEATDSEAGFYAGFVLNNELSETVSIQLELIYLNLDNTSFLQLPMFTKFYIGQSPFNIQGGFQITYTLEEVFNDFTKFNIGIGPGLGYDITDNFFVEGRYVIQLNDYFNGPEDVLDSKINFLNIGLGYKF